MRSRMMPDRGDGAMRGGEAGGAEMERCAHACAECRDLCLRLVPHCLGVGGEHAEADHVNAILDCAGICELTAGMLHRGSWLHAAACAACAEICEQCARDCERVHPSDERMHRAAEACWRCAELCDAMVG